MSNKIYKYVSDNGCSTIQIEQGFSIDSLVSNDLDGFKAVNDTLGHDAGDYVLQQIAQRMLSCVRKTDTVARIEGDEFLIIATEINAPENAALIADGHYINAEAGSL